MLWSTGNPDELLADSSEGGKRYRITGIGTPWLACSCPAGRRGRECRHALEAMIYSMAMIHRARIEEQMTEEERALVPVTSGLVLRKDITQRSKLMRQQMSYQVGAMGDAVQVAAMWQRAGLLPDVYRRQPDPQAAAALVIMKAGEVGVPISAAFDFFYLVGNKISLQGQMVAALVARTPGCRIEVEKSDEKGATCTGYRPGWKPYTYTYTVEKAIRSGFYDPAAKPKQNRDGKWIQPKGQAWKNNPEDKVVWACVARIGRRMFPDILSGMDVVAPDGEILDEFVVEVEEDLPPPVVDEDGVIVDEDAAGVAEEGEFREVDDENGSDPDASNDGPEPEPEEIAEMPADDPGPRAEPEWVGELEAHSHLADQICEVVGIKPGLDFADAVKAVGAWMNDQPDVNTFDHLIEEAMKLRIEHEKARATQPTQPMI